MANIDAVHKKLDSAYNSLPKKKRSREFGKTVGVVKRMIDELVMKNAIAKEQIIIVVSECQNDLLIILEQLEALCDEGKKTKDSRRSAGQSEHVASTSAACSGEPGPISEVEYDMTWQNVQDQNDEVASLRRTMVTTINKLREELREKDEQITRLRTDLDEVRSRLYVGEIVVRLNDYVKRGGLNSVKELTESIARDPSADKAVKTMVEAALQHFKDAKRFSPLEAFKQVAKGVTGSRIGIAHPELVDLDTLTKACSGPERLLLRVLSEVAEDKVYPLRKIIYDEY